MSKFIHGTAVLFPEMVQVCVWEAAGVVAVICAVVWVDGRGEPGFQ